MEKIAKDFKDHGVVFYVLYTREPHAGAKLQGRDFTKKKQTQTHQERVDNALELLKDKAKNRPIMIDTFGDRCLQKTIGGGRPNSLVVMDKRGKVALWQDWSDAKKLREKLEELTGFKPAPADKKAKDSPESQAKPAEPAKEEAVEEKKEATPPQQSDK